jgi:hypothetical protein
MSDCKHPQGPEAHHRFTRNVDHIGKHCLDSMWEGTAADIGGATADDSTVARMAAADAIVGRYMRQKAGMKYAEILEFVGKQGIAKVFG